MIKRLCFGFLIVLALVQSGCFYRGHHRSAPVDNVDFAVMKKLSEIDGTYRDTSEKIVFQSGQGCYWESLSGIFWPPGIAGAFKVEVRALGEDRFSIKSLDLEERILKEQVFVAGQDFEFTEGRIRFRKSNLLVQDRNDALLGPDTTTIEFGIDKAGQAKVRKSYSGAGLFMVILPVVIKQTDEYRFQRIEN